MALGDSYRVKSEMPTYFLFIAQVDIYCHEFCHGGRTERLPLRWASCKVKMGYFVKTYENKNVLFVPNLGLGIRISRVGEVRVKIKFKI